ncbi:hypothetical protein EDD21DRAFT_388549 [Dissophora ornata]|nr:hypothetical protein EDD21DRAFT_388549 [Dissophora ornata]
MKIEPCVMRLRPLILSSASCWMAWGITPKHKTATRMKKNGEEVFIRQVNHSLAPITSHCLPLQMTLQIPLWILP